MKLIENTPLPLYYLGPDIEKGPLPTVIYLALSAEESLLTPPFNQAVSHLEQFPIRIFSVDLPFHGKGYDSREALPQWAHAFAEGDNLVDHFLLKLQASLEELLSIGAVQNNRFGLMGLSRGGFLINHLAAKMDQASILLSFAPLTEITAGKDFDFLSLTPLLKSLNLSNFSPNLCTKTQRIYIGNRDTRVSTDACYQWFRSLVENAHDKGIRSPHIELMIRPSIGHQGHGTSKESFEEGAAWLIQKLLS
jgi:esterase FrsA